MHENNILKIQNTFLYVYVEFYLVDEKFYVLISENSFDAQFTVVLLYISTYCLTLDALRPIFFSL